MFSVYTAPEKSTSFPGSLILPLARGGGKMRDPGNEVAEKFTNASITANFGFVFQETSEKPIDYHGMIVFKNLCFQNAQSSVFCWAFSNSSGFEERFRKAPFW